MTDLIGDAKHPAFNPAAPLPAADTATVDASKTVDTLAALLNGIKTCAQGAAAHAYGSEGTVQFAAAAEHFARALDVVADFGAR